MIIFILILVQFIKIFITFYFFRPPLFFIFFFSVLSISFCANFLCFYLFQEHFLHHRLYMYHYLINLDDGRYSRLILRETLRFDFNLFMCSLSMVSSVQETRGLDFGYCSLKIIRGFSDFSSDFFVYCYYFILVYVLT